MVNLSLIYKDTNRLEESYETLKKAIEVSLYSVTYFCNLSIFDVKIEEDYFYGEVPLSVAHYFHNLAIVERARNNLDEAEKLYFKFV